MQNEKPGESLSHRREEKEDHVGRIEHLVCGVGQKRHAAGHVGRPQRQLPGRQTFQHVGLHGDGKLREIAYVEHVPAGDDGPPDDCPEQRHERLRGELSALLPDVEEASPLTRPAKPAAKIKPLAAE